MSILSRILGVEAPQPLERKDVMDSVVDASPLTFAALLGEGFASKTGAPVNVATVLRIATAFACCRVIAEDIGKLPLRIYQRIDRARRVARDHALFSLLADQPNDWQTSMEWRQMMMMHAALTHGGYSWINRSGNGRILELIPLMHVIPRQSTSWELSYDVCDTHGKIATLQPSEVFRVQGPTWNGFTGLELIVQGREAFGLAIATEESQARLHSNGARPGGIITGPNALTDTQVDRIKAQFGEKYEGLQNAFKTLLLDNGLEFKSWAMTGVDAQHLETRRHQIEEVCRLFRVFPSMIGHSDKASTFASAEAFFRAHVGHTLQPWIVRWEQAIARDLLLPGERKAGYFAKLDPRGLLRGDDKARSSYYRFAITDGWMTRNEVRDLEDLEPLDGLDEPLMPLNMTGPAGGAGGSGGGGGATPGQDGDTMPGTQQPEEGE